MKYTHIDITGVLAGGEARERMTEYNTIQTKVSNATSPITLVVQQFNELTLTPHKTTTSQKKTQIN